MSEIATVQRKPDDRGMQAVRESEREWETLRFPGQWSKMLFHPQPDSPTTSRGRSPPEAPLTLTSRTISAVRAYSRCV